jgi:hypothetical protein
LVEAAFVELLLLLLLLLVVVVHKQCLTMVRSLLQRQLHGLPKSAMIFGILVGLATLEE